MLSVVSIPGTSPRPPWSGREGEPFEFVIGGAVQSRDDVKRWEDAGITRLVLAPWRRSKEAIDGLRRFADLAF